MVKTWYVAKSRGLSGETMGITNQNGGHHGISRGGSTRFRVFGAISHFLPSGYLTVRHGKLPIEIDGLPIENGDFLWLR